MGHLRYGLKWTQDEQWRILRIGHGLVAERKKGGEEEWEMVLGKEVSVSQFLGVVVALSCCASHGVVWRMRYYCQRWQQSPSLSTLSKEKRSGGGL